MKVVRYSWYRSGSEIQPMQYDPEGNPLFTKEHADHWKYDTDVCVIMADSPEKPGFWYTGLPRFKYDGQISRKYPFTPTGQGVNIFVTDSRNNFIDVISKDGNFLYSIDYNSIKEMCLDNQDGTFIVLTVPFLTAATFRKSSIFKSEHTFFIKCLNLRLMDLFVNPVATISTRLVLWPNCGRRPTTRPTPIY